jgi:hypothetical protein
MHPREQIVQTVVTLLIAAGTAASTRVENTRIDPRRKTELPAISVYARNDPTNAAASSEMEEAHDLVVEIVGMAEPSAINALMEEIEDVIRDDPYLGGVASDSRITRTPVDVGKVDGRSDPAVAFAALNVVVRYHIALAAT